MDRKLEYAVSGLLNGKLAYASKETFCDANFGRSTVFDLDTAAARYRDVLLNRGGTNVQIRPIISKNPLVLGEPVSAETIEELRKRALKVADAKKAALRAL